MFILAELSLIIQPFKVLKSDSFQNSSQNLNLPADEVLLRLPNTEEVIKAKLSPFSNENAENELFIAQAFDTNTPSYLFNLINKTSLKNIQSRKENLFPLPELWDNFSFELHKNKVVKAQEKIATGAFKKLVIAQKFKISIPRQINLLASFQEIVNSYENAFCCLLPIGTNKWWLGATPELLLSYNALEKKAYSMSLAATQIAESTLPWGTKEINEQQIVTNYISEKAKALKIDFATSLDKELIAGNLKHLLTTFQFNVLNKNQAKTLLKALHPTPAVASDVLDEGLNAIKDIEQMDRSFYAGYWGVEDVEGNFHFFVNLRCVEIEITEERTELSFYAGGGITSASKPEDEAQEVLRKMKVIGSKLLFS